MARIVNPERKRGLGRQILTKEIINNRIAHTGIELVSEYTKSINQHIFRCKMGHEWNGRPSHVMRGSGCPTCSGKPRRTTAEVNEILSARGIRIVGEFKSWESRSIFECINGHRWETQSGTVISGSGCARCLGIHPEQAAEKFYAAAKKIGIDVLEEYKTAKTKLWVICKNNHKYLVTPDSIMSGNGCNQCAIPERGFKSDRPASFYLIKMKNLDGLEGLGFGVSNNPKYRINQHRILFTRNNIEWSVVGIFNFDIGKTALEIERTIKRHPSVFDFNIPSFRSECLPIEMKDYILAKIESHKD